MIRNLGVLVSKMSRASCRYDKENALALYCGEDWKEYIQYGKRFELLLYKNDKNDHIKLLLNGVKDGEKTFFDRSTLIKVLPDDSEYYNGLHQPYYYISSGKIRNDQEVYGNVIEMGEGSYLISEKQINFLSLTL